MSESDLKPDAQAPQSEASANVQPSNEVAGEQRNELAEQPSAGEPPAAESGEAGTAEEQSLVQPAEAEPQGDHQEEPGEAEEPAEEPLEALGGEQDGADEEPLEAPGGEQDAADEEALEDEGQGLDSAAAEEERPQPPPRAAVPQEVANDDPVFVPEPLPTRLSVPAVDPELEDLDAAAIEQPTEEDAEYSDTPFDKLVGKAKRLSPERIRTILESLLFVTDKPLGEEAMRGCTGLEVPVIREQLEKLQGGYRDGVRGIVLHEVAGGWQFRTDPTNAEFVRRFLKVKPQRLTRAALETLAIVAYRQPVTRPEIEDVRAVDSGAVIKALLERRLVKIIGKRDEPGRPLLYGTTQEFLEFFNLRDLGSLPTLREFQELSEESREIVDRETSQPEPPKGTDTIVADLKDNAFELKLAETTAEADDALAELELALADTETKAKETAEVLNPRAPQSEQEPEEEDGEDAAD